jgi:hypothetical protein
VTGPTRQEHAHDGSCWQAVSIRFAPPGEAEPAVLAAEVTLAMLTECQRRHAAPEGLIMLSVGPSRYLVDLFTLLSDGEPADMRTVANSDQVTATMRAEPDRFAGMAVAHVRELPGKKRHRR